MIDQKTEKTSTTNRTKSNQSKKGDQSLLVGCTLFGLVFVKVVS